MAAKSKNTAYPEFDTKIGTAMSAPCPRLAWKFHSRRDRSKPIELLSAFAEPVEMLFAHDLQP